MHLLASIEWIQIGLINIRYKFLIRVHFVHSFCFYATSISIISVSNFVCYSICRKVFSSKVIMFDSITTKCIMWYFIMNHTLAPCLDWRWRNLFRLRHHQLHEIWSVLTLDICRFIEFQGQNLISYQQQFHYSITMTSPFFPLSFSLYIDNPLYFYHLSCKWSTQLVGVAHFIAFVQLFIQYVSLHWSNQPLELMAMHAKHTETMNSSTLLSEFDTSKSILVINISDFFVLMPLFFAVMSIFFAQIPFVSCKRLQFIRKHSMLFYVAYRCLFHFYLVYRVLI